ncbi:tyrosine-type recombinase/integrase [Frankia sp. AiPa1]|uniref:site-specific integrase n=1 Tax=Frankia sp. AiPa1 TaxID=573492 RepID=UPI0035A89D46
MPSSPSWFHHDADNASRHLLDHVRHALTGRAKPTTPPGFPVRRHTTPTHKPAFPTDTVPHDRQGLENLLDQQRRTLGPDHPDTLATASWLGVSLIGLGEHRAARTLLEDTHTRSRATLADRLYPLWHLMAFRALRRGETVALGWTEVDFDNDSIYILDNLPGSDLDTDDDADLYDDPKSESGARTIGLDPTARQVLQSWQTVQANEQEDLGAAWTDSGRVFTHPDGTALNADGVSQRFERLITRFAAIRKEHAEHRWSVEYLAQRHRMPPEAIETALSFGPLPPIRLHDLRHTAASLTYLGSRDLKVVSELLGHASVHFTGDVYTSIFAEADRAAAQAATDTVPRRYPPAPPPPSTPPASPSTDGPDLDGFDLDL